jgi:hypothetical protein
LLSFNSRRGCRGDPFFFFTEADPMGTSRLLILILAARESAGLGSPAAFARG